MIEFFVPGRAQPAGSKRAYVPLDKNKQPYHRKNGTIIANIVDDNKKSKPWQKVVAGVGRRRYRGEILTGPLRVSFVILHLRPKNHYGTGRNAERLKESARLAPIVMPDVLKLSRGIEDALTGVIWKDDAQIVVELLYDCYVSRFTGKQGVAIRIEPLEVAPTPKWALRLAGIDPEGETQ